MFEGEGSKRPKGQDHTLITRGARSRGAIPATSLSTKGVVTRCETTKGCVTHVGSGEADHDAPTATATEEANTGG